MEELDLHHLEDSYKNPFAHYNANVLKVSQILNYWCNPFNIFNKFADISEEDIYKEPNPLVFMGGRGSGKTMFLRYWTYEVQKESYLKGNEKDTDFLEYLNRKGGVATYIRIDGPILRSFEGFGLPDEKWKFIFSHYFELLLCKSILLIIKDLIDDNLIKSNVEVFRKYITKLLKVESNANYSEIIDEVNARINEVTTFRGDIALFDIDFKPTKSFPAQSLSFEIPMKAKELFSELNSDFNFTIIIDEFENFLVQQQVCINTLLKFVKPGLTFRIGMRLEGFRTYDTISKDDFIKEGRDYQKVVLEDAVNMQETGYLNYLKKIAEKRLEQIPIFKQNKFTDISKILGYREYIEEEALQLTSKNSLKHFTHYKNYIPNDAKTKIRYRENPLLELLAIIMVIRGIDINDISKAFTDQKSGIPNELYTKIKYDYTNKYKYSLMVLLTSIYRKNKLYYSFNTFGYLSSGIIGHFIELCRRSFQIAEFENKTFLIEEGEISKENQAKAARDYSISELQQINRIEDYGNHLYQMVENIGNVFREYHKDILLRYPETNQFSVDKTTLTKEPIKSAFNSGLKWSVILKKNSLQTSSPGSGRTELYALNRIFSPEFQLSYRTRGGYNEEYSKEDIEEIMLTNSFKPKKNLSKARKINNTLGQQKLDL
ncbi:MAG: hypothetical protein PF484_06200 [Bacteroidales bacterium]|nr:hypothetical protein [Bacteroidales bacterium]